MRVLALEHGYHGDTIGAMSTGARSVFNAAYEPLLFDVTRIPFPRAGGEQETLDALEAACRGGDAAAFVVEPLVLGAGGMLVYGADTLREMRRICATHGVLFVADEVMTGFGRTGTLFACEQAGIVPGHRLLCEGHHRRLAAARGHHVHGGDFRRALLDRSHAHLFSLELLHRQSDRLRGGARQSRHLGERGCARPYRAALRDAGGAAATLCE